MAGQQKLPWTFERGVQNEGLRNARALEHIAHYLDLIEGHLSDIATTLAKGGPKDVALSISLTNIADAIKAKS
jgi:hypothetical protein